MTKLEIPAKHFRKFEDPFSVSPRDDKPVKYRFYARVSDVPEELLDWMGTNPRDQNLNTDVSKAIRESLMDAQNPRFHLWNRGILISAAAVNFDNRSGIASIFLDDDQIHGNIDGGHTLRVILQCKRDLTGEGKAIPNQYVDIEVITGLDSPEALAEARNTSNAVDLKSMEELRDSFKVLKDILNPCYIDGDHYIERIEFRQNQMRAKDEKNAIDVREIISIINMFNQNLYPIFDINPVSPIQSFSGKEIGLKRFLQGGLSDRASDEERKIAREKSLQQMAPIIPGIFELWDYIERHFTEATAQIGKRYGFRGYSNYDKKKRPPAMFSNAELNHTIPKGIMYPLVGAFRALVRTDSQSGEYSWAVDPIPAWEDLKPTLAGLVMSTSDELSHNPANIGRSPNLWNSMFMSVLMYATRNDAMKHSEIRKGQG